MVQDPPEDKRPSITARGLAWSVHIYTASGVLWALLTLAAIFDGRIGDVYFWMLIAVIVDATDGYLARYFRVKDVLPHIDGGLLDNIIDYLNWSFVPAVFLWFSGWLTEPGIVWAGCILVCSAFAFVHTDAKVVEHGYFRGFPSYWNIFAFLCDITVRSFGADDPAGVAFIITAVLVFLCLLSVLPVYFVYPTRAQRWRGFFTWGSGIWTCQCGAMILLYPDIPDGLYLSSLVFPVIYLVLAFLWTPGVHRELRSKAGDGRDDV